jgi:hypothetical protein
MVKISFGFSADFAIFTVFFSELVGRSQAISITVA